MTIVRRFDWIIGNKNYDTCLVSVYHCCYSSKQYYPTKGSSKGRGKILDPFLVRNRPILSWLSRPRGDLHPLVVRIIFHRPFPNPIPFLFGSHAWFSHRDKVISAEINYSSRGENANSPVGEGGNLYAACRGYFALALKWPISFTYTRESPF